MIARMTGLVWFGVFLVTAWGETGSHSSAARAGQGARSALGRFAAQPSRSIPGRILVKFRPSAETPGVRLAAMPVTLGRITRRLDRVGWVRVELPPGTSLEEALEVWRRRYDVEAVEPEFAVRLFQEPADPAVGGLWGLQQIKGPEAWAIATGAAEVVVGIVDSGIDYLHPDLAPNVWRNPAEIPGNGKDDDGNGYVDDVFGIDVVDSDSDPMDDGGHGTHVAGTVGAVGGNGFGIAGVAPNIRMMALRIFSADGFGGTGSVVEALDYVMAMKERGAPIRVMNHSWGGSIPSLALKEAFTRAGEAGILSVCAAGNARGDNDTRPTYPAGFTVPALLSVAASDWHDDPALFSNYGAQTVHLGAPGVGILSTYKGGALYTEFSGTSMAAPHVTGAAALLFGLRPEWPAEAIRVSLLETVDVLPAWRSRTVTGGRLNVQRAANRVLPPAVPPAAGASTGPRVSHTAVGTLELVSRAVDGGLGTDNSFGIAASRDARWVAFASDAANLVPADTNGRSDIFLLDRSSGGLRRVSVGPDGVQGNGHSEGPAMSADGRYTVFHSWASNLTPVADSNNGPDVFLYDRETETLTLISQGRTGSAAAGWSYEADISADGGRVVFSSDAPNLTARDLNGTYDVFAYSTLIRTLRRVSDSPFDLVSDEASGSPSVSADGRFVAFDSLASNLSPIDYIDTYDVFVADLETGAIELVSIGADGESPAEGDSIYPVISADGRFVLYQSYATNLVQGVADDSIHVYLHDRSTGTARLVSRDGDGRPAGSSDYFAADLGASGRFAVFMADTAQFDSELNQDSLRLYRYDALADHVVQLNFNATGRQPLYGTFNPRLSDDERHATFSSPECDLLPGDGNAVADSFVVDWPVFPPDLRARVRGGDRWSGSGIIGERASQRLELDPARATPVTIEVELIHTGFAAGRFELRLAELPASWVATVAAEPSGSTETGSAPGQSVLMWATPSLEPGQRIRYTLTIGFPTAHPTVDMRLTVSEGAAAEVLDAVGLVFRGTPSFAPPQLLSRTPAGAPGNGWTFMSSMSADGRYVAFASDASNLVPQDHNRDTDVFLFDRSTERLEAISLTASRATGSSQSMSPSVSDDGRFVAFESMADDLVADDTNGVSDIFLKDRISGRVTRIAAGEGPGRKGSESPVLSGDGRVVVFRSIATNLVSGDTNASWDILAFDRLGTNTTVISRRADGIWANADSEGAVVSRDGRFVAFTSFASNLTPNDTNGVTDVFLVDRSTGAMELVSRTPAGNPGNGESHSPSVSDDGRWVLFGSSADDLVESTVSAGARAVADAYLYDREAGRVTTLSARLGLPAEAAVAGGLLAGDGRHVLFNGWDLGGSFPTGSPSRVFVADLTTREIQWIGRAPGGRASSGLAVGSTVNRNGSVAIVMTDAADLVGEDPRNQFQLLGVTLTWNTSNPGEADQDGDQLPDEWERAHFQSLDADPKADPDGDGFDNRSEFLAGTDPVDSTSRLGLSVAVGATGIQLEWASVAGRRYRIEHARQLGEFVPMAAGIAATPPRNGFMDTSRGQDEATVFYRLTLEP